MSVLLLTLTPSLPGLARGNTIDPEQPMVPYETPSKPSAAQVAKATALMNDSPARMAPKVLKLPSDI